MHGILIKGGLTIIFGYCFLICQAQDIKIQLGQKEIGENQIFTISLIATNSSIKSYNKFPDIKGLRKRGTSSSSSTNIMNGRITSSHSIIMTYSPEKQGVIIIQPFEIQVNGKSIKSKGGRLTVGPPVQQQPGNSLFNRDPFEDFFGRRNSPMEFIDIKEDAFLAVTIDKKEVYVGEGFTATLAFYVAESNRAPLQFYNLGKQLGDILKLIKPANCWEENFNIEKINGLRVIINEVAYTQYKLYQGEFYPLNTEPIIFPAIELEMVKYKVAKNPTFFGQNRQEGFKVFHSRPISVHVKDLPPHPLKDEVAVGQFRLNEKISKTSLLTGESFSYEFNVFGEGNTASIAPPVIPDSPDIEFYPPNTEQKIERRNGRVTGAKSFYYYGIPNEPGDYNLDDYFQWIYFNVRKDVYDTLRSKFILNVTGDSRKNETIIANDLGTFYNLIDVEENTIHSQNEWQGTKVFANVFILLIAGASIYIILKK